jgi:hypothetical protein
MPDPEPVDTYHDDMRRFFCGLLIALPIAGALWGVLVVAIILGIAKAAGH